MRAGLGSVMVTGAVLVVLTGCGAGGGRSGDRQQIVTAAKAPLLAAQHRDVRAYCEAYTPRAAHQLVLNRRPRVSGGCEDAMRALVTDPQIAQLDGRVAAGARLSDVVIRGDRATAQIRLVLGAPASTMTFVKEPDGRWLIASLAFSANVSTRIR
jgi:ketosteroid isomerase-like protein